MLLCVSMVCIRTHAHVRLRSSTDVFYFIAILFFSPLPFPVAVGVHTVATLEKSYSGKVVWITGASRGLGEAIAIVRLVLTFKKKYLRPP